MGARRTRAGYEFTTQVIENPSGMFVMLTDGVTDVMNDMPQPTAFGRRRLKSLIENLNTSDPETLAGHIMEAINGHKGTSVLRDDLTLMVFYIHSLEQTHRESLAEPAPEAELQI